jgi:hypothetical protein
VSECNWFGQFQVDNCPNIGGASLSLTDSGWSFRAASVFNANAFCFFLGSQKHPAPESSPIGQWNSGLSIS